MAGNRRVTAFCIDASARRVSASIDDLSAAEADYLCHEFERESGLRLELGGQLGFGF